MKVIHRDIKPSNILLNKKGWVKIADFGVSKKIEATYDCMSSWVGTVTYMSPERLIGEQYIMGTDIWSLGVILIECVTGNFPFQAQGTDLNFWQLVEKITKDF